MFSFQAERAATMQGFVSISFTSDGCKKHANEGDAIAIPALHFYPSIRSLSLSLSLSFSLASSRILIAETTKIIRAGRETESRKPITRSIREMQRNAYTSQYQNGKYKRARYRIHYCVYSRPFLFKEKISRISRTAYSRKENTLLGFRQSLIKETNC